MTPVLFCDSREEMAGDRPLSVFFCFCDNDANVAFGRRPMSTAVGTPEVRSLCGTTIAPAGVDPNNRRRSSTERISL
uniref:Conserved domain protein n=1 Tax=Steinernema glaseri TaxID=37863 RepID=A0A1I7Y9N6_9BILA